MDTNYSIIRSDHSSWTVDHGGDVGGEHATKEATFGETNNFQPTHGTSP